MFCRDSGRTAIINTASILLILSFVGVVSCGAADPDAVAAIAEWDAVRVKRQAGSEFLTALVNNADLVVAANVTNARDCRSTSAKKILGNPPTGYKLACGTLHVVQVLRGDRADKELEVLYLDYLEDLGVSGLIRLPVGPDGSAGIYFLRRRGNNIWALVSEARSYFPIVSKDYIPYSQTMSIQQTIAVNLLNSISWTNLMDVDRGYTIDRVSEAIQLTGLDFVGAELERLTARPEKNISLPACMLIKSRLGDFVDCAQRLRQNGGLSADEDAYLKKAEREGERERGRVIGVLAANKPVVLQGLMNAAPGGECEFVRSQLKHRVEEIRSLARKRLSEVCRGKL